MIPSLRILFILIAFAAPLWSQTSDSRRLEVLFLGDDRGHNPVERYRVLKQALGPKGFNLSYVEDLSELTRETLDLHDALIVYANHESDTLPTTIIPWVKDGGALVALHSACGCFHPSEEWFELVGGRFESHEGHIFIPQTVDKNHPITKELPELEAWDETYEHQNLGDDLHILQEREPMNADEEEPEPWTWTRTEGEGRVFYTASGHDLRVWTKPAYQTLVERGILWAVGEERVAEFQSLELPELEIETPRVTNRAHPDIPMMDLQKPLSPAESALHAQVPAGSKLVLFASEPMVINPIAIDWDNRGRAWVVESYGYPNDVPDEPDSGDDNIKILEDTNGDGQADKMTLFAEGLRHCTTTAFVNGGVVATDGRDIVFLRDDDGDDRADTREVLATGLNISDTHASTSHFLTAMDGWVYATVGYSGVEMEVGGETHKFGSGVFRFRPDLSELEFIQPTTNNTWGLGFSPDGEILGSTANNNPSWMVSVPNPVYKDSGLEQPRTPRLDDQPFIYPNTLDITQVDQINKYTAAAGHMLYNDRFFKDLFRDNPAFICAPTGHLVALGRISEKGSLKSIDLRGRNLYASADAWSSPVAARPGPDGAIWIADWYNPIVQHNVVFRFWNPARGYDYPHSPYHVGDRGPGKGNAYVTPLRDREHGRIWRVVPENETLREKTVLDPANPTTLIAALNSPSQHLRLQAQRMLAETQLAAAVPRLSELITSEATPEGMKEPLGAYHAIRALQGLGEIGNAQAAIAEALESSHAGIRLQAALALEPTDPALIARLPDIISQARNQADLRRLFTVAAQAIPNEPLAEAIWNQVSQGFRADEALEHAAALAMRNQSTTFLAVAFDSESQASSWLMNELETIATRVANSPKRPALVALIENAPKAIQDHFQPILDKDPPKFVAKPKLPASLVPGREAYLKSCVECHQVNGEGLENTFPPLDSAWVRTEPDTMLRIMLGGLMGPITVKGAEYNSAMPGHSHASDEELAAIASYVRYDFGGLKEKALIKPEQVKALRPEVKARKFRPWTVPELDKARQE
jgi:putative membrane-bound dehydrogenase-like protein